MHERALNRALKEIREALSSRGITLFYREKRITLSSGKHELSILVQFSDAEPESHSRAIPVDYIVSRPPVFTAYVLNRLHMNRRVFARSCNSSNIEQPAAIEFHRHYHFLGHGGGLFHRGLLFKGELLAVASFSRGRKMDRLPPGKRSFEMVRFTIKSGFSIPGGLSKLVRHFCIEKNAGDVMTYVDRQLSAGESFIAAGFKRSGETEPHRFMVDRRTYEREPFNDLRYDERRHFIMNNAGSIKMIFQPAEAELS